MQCGARCQHGEGLGLATPPSVSSFAHLHVCPEARASWRRLSYGDHAPTARTHQQHRPLRLRLTCSNQMEDTSRSISFQSGFCEMARSHPRRPESKEVYNILQEYMPAKLAFGLPHPDPVVETASLASVEPPDITYELHLDDLVASGGLSALQLESIVYACQRHATVLPDAQRAGFFIGDGAGVGKGRTIAGAADFVPASGADLLPSREQCSRFVTCRSGGGCAASNTLCRCHPPSGCELQRKAHSKVKQLPRGVQSDESLLCCAGLILENWRCGRKKHLWLSIGSDLRFDSRRWGKADFHHTRLQFDAAASSLCTRLPLYDPGMNCSAIGICACHWLHHVHQIQSLARNAGTWTMWGRRTLRCSR